MTPTSTGNGPAPDDSRVALAWREESLNGDGHGSSKEIVRARAESDTTRELYAHLINLLSHEGEGGARPAPPSRSPLNGLATLVRRRWLPMLVVGALAFGGLSRVFKPGPALYTATTRVLLPPAPNAQKGEGILADDGSDSVARQYDTEAQIAIITSPRIVRRSVKLLSEREKVQGWRNPDLRIAKVQAQAPISENIIDISVPSLSANSSKRLANIVAGIYRKDTEERTQQGREQNFKFVSAKADEVGKQLVDAQRRLQRFKEEKGIVSLQNTISASGAQIQALQSQYEAARVEAAAGLAAPSVAGDATLASYKAQAEAARAKLEELSVNFVSTAPRVVEARRVYESAQATADRYAGELVAGQQRRLAQIQSQLNVARSQSARLPAVESELLKLTAEVERLQGVNRDVSARLSALSLARDKFIAVPEPLEPATAEGPSAMRTLQPLLLSLIGGLALAALAGMLLERADRGVHSARDLGDSVEAPVLGALPALPGGAETRLTHMAVRRGRANVEAGMLEATYKLRERLVEAAYRTGVRSLLVTSPAKGEGKSLCALNVAASLAFDGHRVLLVDTDFWHPTQHRLAEVPLSPGYSEILSGTSELEAAVRATNVRNLWLLPAGARPANIIEMINGPRNREQLQFFERSFDFVIIDSPPTLSLSDAQVLSALADAVALVVSDGTPREEIQRAEAVLRLTGAHLLGVILNNSRSGSDDADGLGSARASAGGGTAMEVYRGSEAAPRR